MMFLLPTTPFQKIQILSMNLDKIQSKFVVRIDFFFKNRGVSIIRTDYEPGSQVNNGTQKKKKTHAILRTGELYDNSDEKSRGFIEEGMWQS